MANITVIFLGHQQGVVQQRQLRGAGRDNVIVADRRLASTTHVDTIAWCWCLLSPVCWPYPLRQLHTTIRSLLRGSAPQSQNQMQKVPFILSQPSYGTQKKKGKCSFMANLRYKNRYRDLGCSPETGASAAIP